MTNHTDPVYTMIEAHALAAAEANAVGVEIHRLFATNWPTGGGCPPLPDELVGRMTEVDETEHRARRALLDSRPPTIEGCHALITYLAVLIDPKAIST